MPIIRRALTVAAVTAVGTLAFALPAWAHSGTFKPACDNIGVNLTNFADHGQINHGKNTVHILSNGTEIAGLSPVTFQGSSDEVTIPEDWSDSPVTITVTWSADEVADGFVPKQPITSQPLTKPDNCKPETPPASPPAKPKPPAQPVSAPTTSAAPSPTPSPAVEAAKLANTGAGNTVPLLVVGTVLVAGGVGLTFVTRRRRSGSTSS